MIFETIKKSMIAAKSSYKSEVKWEIGGLDE